jgi:hypothetical protein
MSTPEPTTLTEDDWNRLLGRINEQKCTPFLGAEATGGGLPRRSEIALCWAKELEFPFDHTRDLARVAQFMATKQDEPAAPREKIRNEIEKLTPPDFISPDEPHGILADLPLPIYITTDYHDYMFRALQSRKRDARQEICRWNKLVHNEQSDFDSGFLPTVANPVVFHLHGRTGVTESLVLTEDDYFDFLVATSKEPNPIPARIQQSFTRASLLFLGYRLTDLEFRVLLRSLKRSLELNDRRHVSAQVVGDKPASDEELSRLGKVQDYLSGYCKSFHITTYWGTTRQFLVELKQRWDAFPKNGR